METFILLVWLHFLGDFVFQNDGMAKGKSSSNWVLLEHVFVYSIFLLPFGLLYAAVNAVLHAAVDYNSARIAKRFWEKGDRHNFFVTIGADQASHLTCLVLTLPIATFTPGLI